nr:MAG TPA: hypothetical protein [Caudoviricetes sp.]DAP91746.1 MAG TPA: hypothetical protein [Caudoviricetes sp.]
MLFFIPYLGRQENIYSPYFIFFRKLKNFSYA